MPWLAELVESNDSSLDVLPVQCLCEFLLHDSSPEGAPEVEEEEDAPGGTNRTKKKHVGLSLLDFLIFFYPVTLLFAILRALHCEFWNPYTHAH